MKPCQRVVLVSVLLCSFSLIFAQVSPKREFRGIWLATVGNDDWPASPGLPTSTQQQQLISLFDSFKSAGFNAVVFQIRPQCDALYQSSIEPWSYWLTGVEGQAPNPFYDPLEFAVAEAHKRGMELHAWFNPYRAKAANSSHLASNNINNVHPEWILTFADGWVMLDPGLPQVRNYVATVVSDIIRRYDIDGIHADDYFYPYPDTQIPLGITHEDDSSYAHYNGGDTDRAHWRRENINTLIQMIHDSVQAVKPWVKFGMSPFGIWKSGVPSGVTGLDAYSALSCDPLAWLSRGTVDYIAPQLYWPFGGGQDYAKLQPWWADSTSFYGRHLYTGNATYRIGTSTFGGASELANEIAFNRANPKVAGSVQFSASYIPANVGGWTTLMKTNVFLYPAIIPTMSWKGAATTPGAPLNVRLVAPTQGSQYSLAWDAPAPVAGDTAMRFLVYRYPAGTTPDRTDARYIIAMEGGTSTTPSGRVDFTGASQYTFAVAAVDRNNYEGPLSSTTATIPTTTSTAVSTPVPHLPANNELHFAKNQGISWASVANAAMYRVQVDTTKNFPAPGTFLTTNITDTSLALSSLAAQKTYYWHVAAGGQANASPYSDTWSFTTGWPTVPTLLTPPLANNISVRPQFSWTKAGGTSFELTILDGGTLAVVTDTTVQDSIYTPPKPLDYYKIYLWTVTASNAYGTGDVSAQSRFRTILATYVQNSEAIPMTFELSQNYPNPFNPATTIRFAVAQGGPVSLRVYDLLGREIAVLVNDVLQPGYYTARFEGHNLASGIYFYRLIASGFVEVKKMQLLK